MKNPEPVWERGVDVLMQDLTPDVRSKFRTPSGQIKIAERDK